MAMGRKGRDEAERAIASCRVFTNSTGSFYGLPGSARKLGWLEQHADRARIKELLSRASYVVWSYDTPIGFVTEDEVGNITKFYVDEQHTTTTSHHQGILRMAWGEYETIGEGPQRRSRPAPLPRYDDGSRPGARQSSSAVDRANETVRGYAEAARQEPTAAHVYAHGARMSFSGQDDLIDEVRGYAHPSHP